MRACEELHVYLDFWLCKADYRTQSLWLVEGASRGPSGPSTITGPRPLRPSPTLYNPQIPRTPSPPFRSVRTLLSLNISSMIIIDEKSQPMRAVPPPYDEPPPPFSLVSRSPPTLDTLSPHILLQIVHGLFPQTPSADKGKVERQRMTLYHLSTSLRLVNRVFYIG